MRITLLSTAWLLFFLLAPSAHNARCNAAVIHGSNEPDTLSRRAERMILWEKCEDKWNEDKKRTDRCCKGNYKCSHEKCKGKGLCKIMSLWCYNNSCKAKGKKDKNKKDKDKKNKDKKNKDKKNKDKKDKDKKDKDKKDKDKKDKDKDKRENDEDEEDEPDASGEEELDDDEGEEEEEEVTPSPTPSQSSAPSPTPEEEQVTPSPTPSQSSAASPSPSPSNIPWSRTVNSPRPSPAMSPAPRFFDPLNCNGHRNRREIRDLSPAERERWQQAIVRLRADRDQNGDSEWDRLVRLHMQHSDEAHGGSYFLPWHRLFLLRLENALRRYEPDLALPYWDWTIDAHDAATSPVWGPGYLGGARAGNQPIVDGPFQGMDGRYPSPHIVRRNFNSGTSGAIPQLWNMNALNDVINANSFEEFSDGIESAHALPHVYIGGDMGDSWLAPNDPVFGLHHAFVDRLYSMRQARRGVADFGGTHDFRSGRQNTATGRVFEAFGVPAMRAFQVSCVSYEAPRLQGRTVGGGRERPEDACHNEAFRNGHSMSEERCERGNAVLQGSE